MDLTSDAHEVSLLPSDSMNPNVHPPLKPESRLDFSLVIPCYKDAPHLVRNSTAIANYLARSALRWEMIFVEDGSPDDTRDVVRKTVEKLCKFGHDARALFQPRNMGRGQAVTDGIIAARGQVAGFIDIDLEHRMDAILPMVSSVLDGEADVVAGRRTIVNGMAKPIRVICSHGYRVVSHLLLNLPVADTECGLKVFDRTKILPVLLNTVDRHWFWDTEILHRAAAAGLKIKEHWVIFVEDPAKRSTVRLIPDIIAYFRAIFRYRKSLRTRPWLAPIRHSR